MVIVVEGDAMAPTSGMSLFHFLDCSTLPFSLPHHAECKGRWHPVPFFESLV